MYENLKTQFCKFAIIYHVDLKAKGYLVSIVAIFLQKLTD